jgi:hypothetical protein
MGPFSPVAGVTEAVPRVSEGSVPATAIGPRNRNRQYAHNSEQLAGNFCLMGDAHQVEWHERVRTALDCQVKHPGFLVWIHRAG